MIKWQNVLKWGSGGTISLFLLLGLITNLSGIYDVKHSGDIYCSDTCESYINFTSSYWEFCFEHGNEKDVVYRKTTSPRLWINLDKINNLIPTQPEVNVKLQVPTFGSKWRDIREGDCLKRTTQSNPLPIRLKIIGTKEPEQNVKWGLNLNHWSSEGIYIDPIWFGLNLIDIENCYQVTTKKQDYTTKEEIYFSNKIVCDDFPNNLSCKKVVDYNITLSRTREYYDKLINTTRCDRIGFKIGNKILNYSKQGYECSRNNFIISCDSEIGANKNGICESGERCFEIDVRDFSIKSLGYNTPNTRGINFE